LPASDLKFRKHAAGMTLIEVLIAFVVLSIGLLGIITLMTVSKGSHHQAVQRDRAVSLADAIVERIRINPAGVTSYHTGLSPRGANLEASEPSPNCRSAACTPAQLAAHDLWAWERALGGLGVRSDDDDPEGGLINPRGCIQFTPVGTRVNTGELNVIIQWRGTLESVDAVADGEPVCGGEPAGTDRYRRQVVVNTYVIDEAEL